MPPSLRSSKPRPLVSPFSRARVEKPQARRKYNKTKKLQKKHLNLENGLLDLEPNAPVVLELTKENAKSQLLGLPAELRNQIWKYVLDEGYIFRTFAYYLDGKQARMRARGARRNWLGLLQSCRQIYSETALLPFQLSPFYASNNKASSDNDFLQRGLLPGQAAAISHVTFSYFSTQESSIDFPLLSGLKTLTVSGVNVFISCEEHAALEPVMRRWIQDTASIPNEVEIYFKYMCRKCCNHIPHA